MSKKILEAMKQMTVQSIKGKTAKLIRVEERSPKDSASGQELQSVIVEAEVPKGCGAFSRQRFDVKILNGKRHVSDADLEQYEFGVTFKNLEISYIDERGNVYFRAEDYNVKKMEG